MKLWGGLTGQTQSSNIFAFVGYVDWNHVVFELTSLLCVNVFVFVVSSVPEDLDENDLMDGPSTASYTLCGVER